MIRRIWRTGSGFTLIELMVAVAILVIVSAVAMPQLGGILERLRVGIAVREMERELQVARVKAVTSNRTIQVLFNCPVAGQYRRVEVLSEPGVQDTRDNQLSRCNPTTYPYPAADDNPLTRPNLDGPLHYLPIGVTMSGVTGIAFSPDGTAHAATTGFAWSDISASGVNETVTKNSTSRSVTINGMGRVYITGR